MQTPEMTQAERELDGRIEYALRVAGRVREQVASFERKVAEQAPPTDEDVARIKAFVLAQPPTAQWQPILTRIGRGELTWREVVDGLATGNADRTLAAAFESLPMTTPENLAELAPETPPAAEKPACPQANEDEFFENPLRLRRR
jgi:hypothetical protein